MDELDRGKTLEECLRKALAAIDSGRPALAKAIIEDVEKSTIGNVYFNVHSSPGVCKK